MKTISDRIREEQIQKNKEAEVVEIYENELSPVEVFEESTLDDKLEEKEIIEVEEDDEVEITEIPADEEEVILEEKTKDELNDYAVRLGYEDEIKGYWSKSKILKTLKKLLGM